MAAGITRFVGAFTGVFGLRFVSGLALEGGWLFEPDLHPLERLPLTLLTPMVVATTILILIQKFSPRRLFDPRVDRPVTQALQGLLAGFFAAVVPILLSLAVEDLFAKVTILVVTSAAATLAMVLRLPKERPDECVHCGCVLSGRDSRCPSCWAENCRGLA